MPAAFAALSVEGEIAAMAFGAVHRGHVSYESVIVDPRRRRLGLARRVLAAIAGWARDNGAAGACLQVEAANAAGRALYGAVGITTELHRYRYRRVPSIL